MSGVWVPALASGVAFAAVQLFVAVFIGPQLSAILAALASMAVLIVLLRFRSNKVDSAEASAEAAFAGAPGNDLRTIGSPDSGHSKNTATANKGVARHYTAGEVFYAWVPYALLVTCVWAW